MGERVAELMGVESLKARFSSTPSDHLRNSRLGHATSAAEPKPREVIVRTARALPQVTIQRLDRGTSDRKLTFPPSLSDNSDARVVEIEALPIHTQSRNFGETSPCVDKDEE